MRKLFSAQNSLDLLAALLTFAALLGVLQTFVVGKHFVIPTLLLLVAVLFGNLARFGLQGRYWAKYLLFWLFFVLACHAFFALVRAADARPGVLFGDAFYPLYGSVLVLSAGLCWSYASKNRLFG